MVRMPIIRAAPPAPAMSAVVLPVGDGGMVGGIHGDGGAG